MHEIPNARLFEISTKDPRRVELLTRETVSFQDGGYTLVGGSPAPNGDADPREDEMRRVPRNFRCPGFVHVAKMRLTLPRVGLLSRRIKKRLGFWGLNPKSRRLATHPRRNHMLAERSAHCNISFRSPADIGCG